jgi:hypothetical protein
MASATSILVPLALHQPPDGWTARRDLALAPDPLAKARVPRGRTSTSEPTGSGGVQRQQGPAVCYFSPSSQARVHAGEGVTGMAAYRDKRR